MEIFFASGNIHKRDEMREIFAPHTILIPSDIGIAFDPEETGATFAENSMIKALSLWNIVKKPVLADDSGICVDILHGEPGIYSARYGSTHGVQLQSVERNILLASQASKALEELSACNAEVHNQVCTAQFVCALVLLINENRFFIAQETLEGTLELDGKGRGTKGFGYDPILFLPSQGKTVAELTQQEKNTLSHRAKAAAAIKKMLGEA